MNISQRIGKTLGFTSATWITIFGGLLALMGIPLFATGYDWIAIAILTFSFLTDWWDGCVARFQQNGRPEMTRKGEAKLSMWERLNYRGVTHLGRSIDPLVDKMRFLGLLWVLGPGSLPMWIILGITSVAAALIFVRPIKRFLRLDNGSANRFGKHKVYAEVVAMILLVFTTRPLLGEVSIYSQSAVIAHILLLGFNIALLLGIASLSEHIRTGWVHYRTRSPAA